ncbi:MAG: hypothetical protein GFH27_549287n131 [Chloroflexi bacterium AL-W]|nr:hypothetical protein [Chloroflexi bacterium AL-N1]NOK66405.1 hypothetical protein [Chloroflexi bacterium AL-N10]NOK71793.1 hypothetical protein [Chloroflexi bacterium AL-N5]NOK81050.1 hypothetical protein [Chloroflexi bacterium AL-W]NOK89323.1 hypothetical protein [Chloroflexi bacterium AL-N15]
MHDQQTSVCAYTKYAAETLLCVGWPACFCRAPMIRWSSIALYGYDTVPSSDVVVAETL